MDSVRLETKASDDDEDDLLREVTALSQIATTSLTELRAWRQATESKNSSRASDLVSYSSSVTGNEQESSVFLAHESGSASDAAHRISASRIISAPSIVDAIASTDSVLPSHVTAATLRADAIDLHAKMIAASRLLELGLPVLEEEDIAESGKDSS